LIVKSLASHKADRAPLISVSLASPQPDTSLHCQTRDTGYRLVHCEVCRFSPVYVAAFAFTHCAYTRRDGQAELTWVAGYIPRWFTRLQTVTHPSTNRARRLLTSLMRPTTLPTKPNRHHLLLCEKYYKIRVPAEVFLLHPQ